MGIDLRTDICGFMLETFQGWGAIFYPKDYIKALKDWSNKNNVLLVFDEIQAGFGRTGKFFGFEHFNVKPDIVVMGKGMGGGLPIGAFTASHQLMQLLEQHPKLGHITTFGGNSMVASAALATLRTIRESHLMNKISSK